jgi:hypothetical protein
MFNVAQSAYLGCLEFQVPKSRLDRLFDLDILSFLQRVLYQSSLALIRIKYSVPCIKACGQRWTKFFGDSSFLSLTYACHSILLYKPFPTKEQPQESYNNHSRNYLHLSSAHLPRIDKVLLIPHPHSLGLKPRIHGELYIGSSCNIQP